LLSSSGEEDEEVGSANLKYEERENSQDCPQIDPLEVHPREESTEDEDQEGDDPDWKFFEEEAENYDGRDDQEKDNPLTRNTIKYFYNKK